MPFAPDLLDSLPAEVRAYLLEREQHIAAREQHIAALEQRIDVLEEQFRLAQLKRFAPSSEKYGLQGCLFNEAESSVQAAPGITDAAIDAADDTPTPGKKRGRKKTAGAPQTRACRARLARRRQGVRLLLWRVAPHG